MNTARAEDNTRQEQIREVIIGADVGTTHPAQYQEDMRPHKHHKATLAKYFVKGENDFYRGFPPKQHVCCPEITHAYTEGYLHAQRKSGCRRR